jgi:hypothetical protein
MPRHPRRMADASDSLSKSWQSVDSVPLDQIVHPAATEAASCCLPVSSEFPVQRITHGDDLVQGAWPLPPRISMKTFSLK